MRLFIIANDYHAEQSTCLAMGNRLEIANFFAFEVFGSHLQQFSILPSIKNDLYYWKKKQRENKEPAEKGRVLTFWMWTCLTRQ